MRSGGGEGMEEGRKRGRDGGPRVDGGADQEVADGGAPGPQAASLRARKLGSENRFFLCL